MSWAREALAAIRQIVLIEHRIDSLTEQVKQIVLPCHDLDRRLVRIEAKFELIERMATPASRRSLDKAHK